MKLNPARRYLLTQKKDDFSRAMKGALQDTITKKL